MPDELNPDELRRLWQDQEVDTVTITIDEIRQRAVRFERRIGRRNVREYAGAGVVLILFGAQLGRSRGWAMLPPALLILGTLYVMWQLHRRSARHLPADAGLKASLEFHRLELERQRDALRSIWSWYLLPIVPGLLATLLVAGADRGVNVRLFLVGGFFAVVLLGIWGVNEWAARRLDRTIAEVKRMEIHE